MSDELTVAGVSLTLYAAVHAAVSEGFPLEVVLEHEHLDPEEWYRADAAWAQHFMASVEGDHALVDEYDRRVLEAQERFRRRVSPIDEDLVAWLDLVRGMSDASDPRAFLAELRLPRNDLVRVHRRWGERFETDEAVRKQAAEVLQQEPGPLPVLDLEPAKLPPPVRERPPRPSAPPPASSPESAVAPPPPLLSELPELGQGEKPAMAPPPRRGADAAEQPPVASSDPRPPSPSVPVPPAPVAAVAPGTLTLMTYACLCAELAVFPDQQERAFAKFGLSDPAVRTAEMQWWRAKLDQSPEERAEYEVEYARFIKHWRPGKSDRPRECLAASRTPSPRRQDDRRRARLHRRTHRDAAMLRAAMRRDRACRSSALAR